VSHAAMSAGKLFHNRAPAVAKARVDLQQLHTATGGRKGSHSLHCSLTALRP